ncbi:MAG: C69 family dipeptidase [Muribaculaceae bacterium]|nr:C69 family dipeptidase [Muribaculaceae bacterium]
MIEKRIWTLGVIAMTAASALACTNFMAGKNATADGSVMITYAADSHTLYGNLSHTPAAVHKDGAMRKVTEWDTGKVLGEIPQIKETYNVVGNMNQYQVAIGETTWGGREELIDTTGNAIIDYGSLIQIALERSKSAPEAIDVMTSLVAQYGYASEGESFTIADKNEVWVMDMIGKGAEKGAVWIAVRIPDDAICAHANEPRIRQVDLKDKKNVRYSKDMIEFARKRGYFNGKDSEFSFADAYCVHDAATRRSCDGRAWAFMKKFDPSLDKYYPWIAGESDTPMPLYVVPNRKLTLEDMQMCMRDHFEGTPLDMTQDVGAGPNHVPYRWRPMSYKVDGKEYCMERATATQQTGWSFISQSRSWLPDAVGGIFWFGTDDTNTCVYMPLYCSLTEVPMQFTVGDLYEFNMNSNFWMNNWVANQAYNRYDLMIPDIRKVQNGLEEKYRDSRKASEEQLLPLANAGMMGQLTTYVNMEAASIAKEATDCYRSLAEFLMVKFLDGNVKKQNEDGSFKRNEYGLPASPDWPGYDQKYYENIVKETGDHFLLK